MANVPYRENQLADSVAAFAEKITPAKARWAYCADRSTYIYHNKKYGSGPVLNLRTMPVCARILGIDASAARFRLGYILRYGLDGAWSWGEDRDKQPNRAGWKPTFFVGPMQAWHVGHLYFARVISHPHVVKIGFSRRVRDRLEDIESKVKSKVEMRPGEIRVGTLADEHWWHRNWDGLRISGEWFFDPRMTERTLPDFLAATQDREAA